jgi:hypothetical protein
MFGFAFTMGGLDDEPVLILNHVSEMMILWSSGRVGPDNGGITFVSPLQATGVSQNLHDFINPKTKAFQRDILSILYNH